MTSIPGHDPHKKTVVVSGLQCRLPQFSSVTDVWTALRDNQDIVFPDGHLSFAETSSLDESLTVSGTDAARFYTAPKVLLQVCKEALADAGYSPLRLKDIDCGLYMSSTSVLGPGLDTSLSTYLRSLADGVGLDHAKLAMYSESFEAFEAATKAVSTGEVVVAVVAGLNNGEWQHVGVHSSDAAVAIVLTTSMQAEQIYANLSGLLHERKQDGSWEKALRTIYNDDTRSSLAHISLSANSTESLTTSLEMINQYLCKERSSKQHSILAISTLTPVIGYCGAASSLLHIALQSLSVRHGALLPHMKTPAKIRHQVGTQSIFKIANARVLRKSTILSEESVAAFHCVSNTSIGHLLLTKPTANDQQLQHSSLQRLALFASSTMEGINAMKSSVLHSRSELLASRYHKGTASPLNPGQYRGFVVWPQQSGKGDTVEPVFVSQKTPKTRPQVYYVLPGMGSQWTGMGRGLLTVAPFRESLERSAALLAPRNFDLMKVILSSDENILSSVVNTFVAITAIQIALLDVLSECGIVPDGIIGHSLGEVAAAYADGCLDQQETILVALKQAQCCQHVHGSMAAVGMSAEEARNALPLSVEVACDNAHDSVTIAGESAKISTVLADLKQQGIFCKEIESCGVPFHSGHLQLVESTMHTNLEEIITQPKDKTHRWISTSDQQSSPCSARYFVNNLRNPVEFSKAMARIPENALVIEIGPSSILQRVLSSGLPSSCTLLKLANKRPQGTADLSATIGHCYAAGVVHDLTAHMASDPFASPVIPKMIWYKTSRESRRSSSKPPTEKSKLVFSQVKGQVSGGFMYPIDFGAAAFSYLAGDDMKDQSVLPSEKLLLLAWQSFSLLTSGRTYHDTEIVMQDVHFLDRVAISPGTILRLTVRLQYVDESCQSFRVVDETEQLVCTGSIVAQPYSSSQTPLQPPTSTHTGCRADLYQSIASVSKAMVHRGHQVHQWNGDWLAHLTAMTHACFSTPGATPRMPARIAAIAINPRSAKSKKRMNVSFTHNESSGTIDSYSEVASFLGMEFQRDETSVWTKLALTTLYSITSMLSP